MKNRTMIIGASAVVAAAVLWAIDGIALTPTLYHLNNVGLVVFLEHAIAFGFMAIPLAVEWKEIRKLSPKDWAIFALLALLSGAIGTMAITQAFFYVNYIPLSVVVFLQKLQPIFAVLVAVFLLKERPNAKFYYWSLVALVGSYFVTFGFGRPVFDVGDKIFVASLFSILAAAAFGAGTALSKYGLNKVNYRVGTYLRFGLTTLIMIFILTFFGGWHGLNAVTGVDLTTLLIIAFTTGGIAIIIYYYGLGKIPASVSSICELAFPFSAVILDYVLHGAVLSVGQWFGAGLLVFSVMAITFGKSKVITEDLDLGVFPVIESK